MSNDAGESNYHHGNLKEALLRSALELLDREGADSLSLRKLARKVGVSHNAPYMHFRDKEAVLAALAEEGWVLLTQAVSDAVVEAGHGADDSVISRWTSRFHAACRSYVRFVLDHSAHAKIMFQAFPIDTYPETAAASVRALEVLENLVEDGQNIDALSDANPRTVATLVWTLLHGIATIIADGKMPPDALENSDPESLTIRFVEAVCEGIGAKSQQ
jgi:AcrR family transcriptional regulator